MLIIVTGGFRSATMYMWGVCKEILKQNNQFKTFGNKNTLGQKWKYRQEGGDICETIHDSYKGREYCRVLIIKKSPNHQFTSFEHIHVPTKKFVESASLVMTHKPIDYYEQMSIGQFVDVYMFCHRNPLDEAAAVVKAQTTIDYNLADPVRNFNNNPANYHISAQELKKSFLYLEATGGLQEIRRGCLSFLLQRKHNNRVHGFGFGDFSKSQEHGKIKKIAEILGLVVDTEEVQTKISLGKKQGHFHYNKKSKKKASGDFFDDELYGRLQNYFLDTMTLMEYIPPDSCATIQGTVIIVTFETTDSNELKEITAAMELLGANIAEIIHTSIVNLETFNFSGEGRFVLCLSELSAVSSLEKNTTFGKHCVIHPYYRALLSDQDTIFELNEKLAVTVDKVSGETLRVLIDWRSANSSATLKNVLNSLSQNYESLNVQICKPFSASYCNSDFFCNNPSCKIIIIGNWNHATGLLHILDASFSGVQVKGYVNSFSNKECTPLKKVKGMRIEEIHEMAYDWIVVCADQRNIQQVCTTLRNNNIEKYVIFDQILDHLKEYKPSCSNTFEATAEDVFIYSLQPRVVRAIAKRIHKRIHGNALYACLPLYKYQEPTLYEMATSDRKLRDMKTTE